MREKKNKKNRKEDRYFLFIVYFCLLELTTKKNTHSLLSFGFS